MNVLLVSCLLEISFVAELSITVVESTESVAIAHEATAQALVLNKSKDLLCPNASDCGPIRLQTNCAPKLSDTLYYTNIQQWVATYSIGMGKSAHYSEENPPNTGSISPFAHRFEGDIMSSSSILCLTI